MNKTVREIQQLMVKRGLTLATAESCTSGGIAREITKVSGSSDYFQGGLVAYQDRLKTQYLGVSAEDIAKYAEGYVAEAKAIFDTIPSQLAHHDKKIKYYN